MIVDDYKEYYPELDKNRDVVQSVVEGEKNKFARTIDKGLKEFNKVVEKCDGQIDAASAFHLYDTYGFPIELTC